LDYILDLRTVLKAILRWSWVIVVFALAGLVYGVNETTKFSPIQTARMIVLPQTSQMGLTGGSGGSSANGLTSKLAAVLGGGGSAAMGGIFGRLQLIMKSQDLARRLDERHGLSREIFAGRWDSEKGKWKTPVKTEPTWRQRLDGYLQQTQNLSLGTESLARAVGGMVKFTPVDKTLFWEIRVQHANPETALRWLSIIYAEADQLLREQVREKTRYQIQFLRERIKTAELSGLRSALFGALIGEEKSLHMMESDLPYAAEIVEPAYASALKTKPDLMQFIVVPVLSAGFAGAMIVILFSIFAKE
jgi:hypothetical protein